MPLTCGSLCRCSADRESLHRLSELPSGGPQSHPHSGEPDVHLGRDIFFPDDEEDAIPPGSFVFFSLPPILSLFRPSLATRRNAGSPEAGGMFRAGAAGGHPGRRSVRPGRSRTTVPDSVLLRRHRGGLPRPRAPRRAQEYTPQRRETVSVSLTLDARHDSEHIGELIYRLIVCVDSKSRDLFHRLMAKRCFNRKKWQVLTNPLMLTPMFPSQH